MIILLDIIKNGKVVFATFLKPSYDILKNQKVHSEMDNSYWIEKINKW